jgi:hypothetical protein
MMGLQHAYMTRRMNLMTSEMLIIVTAWETSMTSND